MKTAWLCGAAMILVTGCGDQDKIAALDKRVEALEKSAATRQAAGEDRSTILLQADEKGYQIIGVDTGTLLVRVDDLNAYLDGYKLHLSIGNPQSITYAGCKVELYWAGKTKTVDLTEELLPGYFTQVEIIATPASVDEIRGLRLAIQTDTLTMRMRKNIAK